MRSTPKQLEDRGHITDVILAKYKSIENHELSCLLESEIAVERSIAARLIGERGLIELLPLLCESLRTEGKLYTRIAICESIAVFGSAALPTVLPWMGRIGSNQHRKIDLIDLKKSTFPLPRDIVSRIVIRMGVSALPPLEDIVKNGSYEQMVEAVDAIGHIAYNYGDDRSEPVLLETYRSSSDELTRWKIIRAFQSYGSKEVVSILEETVRRSGNEVFRKEAQRSLSQIKKRGQRCRDGIH